jgi:hypothetical protein
MYQKVVSSDEVSGHYPPCTSLRYEVVVNPGPGIFIATNLRSRFLMALVDSTHTQQFINRCTESEC